MATTQHPTASWFVPIRCIGMIRRRFRFASITVLTLMVAGGLLLMHGLDTHGSQMHTAAVGEMGALDGHGGHGVDHHDRDESHCEGCMAGAVAACVAVMTAFVSWSLIRYGLAARRSTLSLLAVLDRFRRAVDVFRPPDPAWIRLSVMRC